MPYTPGNHYLEMKGRAPSKRRANSRLEVLAFAFFDLKSLFDRKDPLSEKTKVSMVIYFLVLGFSLTNALFKLLTTNATWSWSIVILLAALGIYTFFRNHLNFKRHAAEYNFQNISPRVADAIENLDSGEGCEDTPDTQVIQTPWLNGNDTNAFSFSPSLDQQLRSGDLDIELLIKNDKRKEIRKLLQNNATMWTNVLKAKWWHSNNQPKPKTFHNDKKICLCDDVRPGKTQLQIYKGSYFLSFLTNELCIRDIVKTDDGSTSVVSAGIDRFPWKPYWQEREAAPQLSSISDNLLSNHLGGNVLAITKDGLLCLWFQDESAQASEGLLAPTGSGSLDWSDLRQKPGAKNFSLLDTVQYGMVRELLEESTKGGGHIDGGQVTYLKIIGYFRNIGRGGLPGFLGVARLNLTAGEVFPNKTETRDFAGAAPGSGNETRFRADTVAALGKSIETIMNTNLYRRQLSLPLYANLHALKIALADPGFKAELFA